MTRIVVSILLAPMIPCLGSGGMMTIVDRGSSMLFQSNKEGR